MEAGLEVMFKLIGLAGYLSLGLAIGWGFVTIAEYLVFEVFGYNNDSE